MTPLSEVEQLLISDWNLEASRWRLMKRVAWAFFCNHLYLDPARGPDGETSQGGGVGGHKCVPLLGDPGRGDVSARVCTRSLREGGQHRLGGQPGAVSCFQPSTPSASASGPFWQLGKLCAWSSNWKKRCSSRAPRTCVLLS